MDDVLQDIVNAVESVRARANPTVRQVLQRELRDAHAVALTGVGKSYEVARDGAALLRSVGIAAHAIHATDMLHGDGGMFGPTLFHGSTLIAISHSGETHETLMAVAASHQKVFKLAITAGRAGNSLTKATAMTLTYVANDGSMHGTIPSASMAAQLAWLSLITCDIADTRSRDELKSYHLGGTLYG